MPRPSRAIPPGIATSWDYIDQKYKLMGKKGEGTFSLVFKGQNRNDGRIYAIKKMKKSFTEQQVRELQEVRSFAILGRHANIIQLREILHDPISGGLSLVCEMMDMNLFELIKDRQDYLPDHMVKAFTLQLLKGLAHMHKHDLFHRDIKPENVLIRLGDCLLKLGDFGSCRSSREPAPYTEYISTRWYRAPECLLTDGHYSEKMDVWSAGCVFYELYRLKPLFPGSSELDQIHRIHSVLGTPDSQLLSSFRQSRHMDFRFQYKPGVGLRHMMQASGSPVATDFLSRLCQYDPRERWTAQQATGHTYFSTNWVSKRKPPEPKLSTGAATARKQRTVKLSEAENQDRWALPSIRSDHVVPVRAAKALKPRATNAAAAAAAAANKGQVLSPMAHNELTSTDTGAYPASSHWQQSARLRPTATSTTLGTADALLPTVGTHRTVTSAFPKQLPTYKAKPREYAKMVPPFPGDASFPALPAIATAECTLQRQSGVVPVGDLVRAGHIARPLEQASPKKHPGVRNKKRRKAYAGRAGGSSMLPPLN